MKTVGRTVIPRGRGLLAGRRVMVAMVFESGVVPVSLPFPSSCTSSSDHCTFVF